MRLVVDGYWVRRLQIDMLETPFGKPQEPHVSSAHFLSATWQNIALHQPATL